MSIAEEQALRAYPECMVYNDLTMEYEDINGCYRIGFEVGYNQAEQEIAEHIKLAYGKVSMNPFDCSEAFEELLKTIGAV